ncbi:MAG: DNA internalization-related competence protein ComEC/Rec2 [Blautia sp.]|jgi:competence protein ComEC
MARRPMCLVLLGVMIVLWLWRSAGNEVSLLPPEIAEETGSGKTVSVCGRVQRIAPGEGTDSIYLTDTYLWIQSKYYSIQNLRIFITEYEDLQAGDEVKAVGELVPVPPRRNPGTFDARSYYAARKIYYLMYAKKAQKIAGGKNKLRPLMERLYGHLRHVTEQMAGENSGVWKALLLGDKGELETALSDYYRRAGMLHLLSISGLHLSFLGLGCMKLLKALGLGVKGSYAVATGVVWCYGALIQGGPSTWRAVWMFTFTAGARLLGRSYDLLCALSLTALMLLFTNPAYLGYSGFLLSFGAVLGLGSFQEIEGDGSGRKKVGGLKKSVRASLGVQLVTLPLVLYYYSEFSLFGILWNLLVLPTAGIALGFGFLGLAAGLFWIPLGRVLLFPGKLLLEGYLLGAKMGASLPFCTWVTGTPRVWKMVFYYLVLALLFYLWKKKRARFALAGLLALNLCLMGIRLRQGLTVTCLDVGQGDGIVWELPDGSNFLVDGGSSSEKQVGRYQLLPYLMSRGIRKLDGIFLTHTDDDHRNGILEILEGQKEHTISIAAKVLYLPDWRMENDDYRRIVTLAEEAGLKVVRLRPGMCIAAQETRIRVLYPNVWEDEEDINGGSLVMELTYRGFRGIFTGDTGANQELDMLERLPDCDFLKVAHHGSKNSTTKEFLEKTKPEAAFISCAEKNRYGHPARETLERLEAAGCRYWITKDYGALTLTTDGEDMRITGFLHP